MAVAYFRQGQRLGWTPPGAPSQVTIQLNAAANWLAFSFVPTQARTLSAVRAFISTKAGTVGAGDITCDLYDSTGTGGIPGSAIESGKTTGTVSGSGWFDWTGFTTSLSVNQQYWAVFKNINGAPATNNVTFRYITVAVPVELGGSNLQRQAWGQASTVNSGSTWGSNPGRTCVRVAYADGSYDGVPASNAATSGVGDGVYATRESGVKFTSPPNGVLQVAGIAMLLGGPTGTPTGTIRFGLWTGSTPSLLAYTNAIPLTANVFSGWLISYFSTTQTLQPGTVCRVTLGETTQSDASSNRLNNDEITWDTDSNSLALLPWEGTCVKTYFDGSNWTDTSGSIFGHALLLDTAGEFGAGGSSAPPNRGLMSGGRL